MRRRELLIVLSSAALLCVRSVAAQQGRKRVIGYLNSTSERVAAPFVNAVRQALREAGYVEGQNLDIAYRWAEGDYDRLPALAADLVERNVEVIIASGGDRSSIAAKSASSTVPIVSVIGGDPVAAGFVASMAHPGGNLTGVSLITVQLMPKRLELLSELVPQAKVIALLVNPDNPQTEGVISDMREAGQAKGMQLHVLKSATPSEIDAVFAGLRGSRADALIIQADPFFIGRVDQLVKLTAEHALPAIAEWRGFPIGGGLLSYGTSFTAVYHQIGVYVGKILSGATTRELPMQQPTKFELVVNLKTAKALGLTVPPAILVRADEVLE